MSWNIFPSKRIPQASAGNRHGFYLHGFRSVCDNQLIHSHCAPRHLVFLCIVHAFCGKSFSSVQSWVILQWWPCFSLLHPIGSGRGNHPCDSHHMYSFISLTLTLERPQISQWRADSRLFDVLLDGWTFAFPWEWIKRKWGSNCT